VLLKLGLIDKINALTLFKFNNCIALVHLKTMNKKFAFIAGQKGPRKMGQITGFRTIDVSIANGSF